MTRAFVTGITGQDGGYLAERLLADGVEVHALAQENDAERGFTLGADDYVFKPFSPRELMLRVNAQLVHVA